MATPTIVDEDTFSIPDGNENDVFSTASAGFYFLTIDENAITGSDEIVVRLYKVVVSGGSYRLIHTQTLTGAKTGEGFYVPAISSSYGWKFSIERTSGTVASIPYIVESV